MYFYHPALSLPPYNCCIVQAFAIPSVASYAIAFGFFKFTNYALFFWLPFFLTNHFSPSESNLISTLYDIGMMPGGFSFFTGVFTPAKKVLWWFS